MPIETQRAWLTEETYGRARILAELLLRRPTGSFVECSDEEQCARRIRRLQELLGEAAVGYEPPDDGIAEPMALTVRYNADDLNARFLMADREEVAEDDLPVYSPQSPVGTALNGAKAGERRKFSVRGGDVVTVPSVSVVATRAALCRANGKASDPVRPPHILSAPEWAPLPFAIRRRCPLARARSGPVPGGASCSVMCCSARSCCQPDRPLARRRSAPRSD